MWQASIACPPALAKKHARPDGQAIDARHHAPELRHPADDFARRK
jgi:hypothetical protein